MDGQMTAAPNVISIFLTLMQSLQVLSREKQIAPKLMDYTCTGILPDPKAARYDAADIFEANERLCRLVTDAAGVASHQKILDVGCGFGGTISSLNDRLDHCSLVGLNIDARQIARARQNVQAKNNNTG